MTQTITFIDSAYPEPHNLREFVWSGRLDDDNDENTSLAYWQSKDLWNNYHKCILSSTYWSDEQGFPVGDANNTFDFSALNGTTFHIDAEPSVEDEESAFSIYLAGHDACANHKISFNQQSDENFHILWQGDIALFYNGFTEFIHQFKADLNDVAFDGFYFPRDWDLDKAITEFKKVLTDFENYEFVVINPKHNFPQYKLVRI